ncbi:helix-turn-helix domain-containing protein [Bradyrhizobium sp. CCGUVB14]|uniref:helix-turn-helix domain-containing protein n=1 Tax=Bradyrhizobium sp. CCGUVB14 TaxID=2949628 RepID=UPI0020B3ADF6|nr:helix-turn-helix domain-containing protein [Bradyrhizobium sp. CCGUVB14]MCP3439818.1 helix-turn-helix domain-containing protein [Bradyrhizobium sp. CCGUVB14]
MVKKKLKRRGRKAILPSVAIEDLQAALVAETRPHVRKRLIGLRAVLSGASQAEAASLVETTTKAVALWLRTARRSGWQTLMRRSSGRASRLRLPDAERDNLIKCVQSALSSELDASARLRLQAMSRILQGERPVAVAEAMHVTPTSVFGWLRRLRKEGVAGLQQHIPVRQPCIDADSSELRHLATRERNTQVRRALLAIALLAEGESPHATGLLVGGSDKTIQRWLGAFREGGVEALRRPVHLGRKTLLSKAQKAELVTFIRANPWLSNRELWALIRQSFGADYTTGGLTRLIKHDLGFVRKQGRFVSA